jgi:hypothetical protein
VLHPFGRPPVFRFWRIESIHPSAGHHDGDHTSA